MPLTLDGTAGMTVPQGAVYNGLQTATAQASTSGTSIDFTGVPLWTKRITVMFNVVSTNGTSNIQAQIGSGSVTTSGYLSNANSFNASPSGVSATSGFLLSSATIAAGTWSGQFQIITLGSNIWVASGVIARVDAAVQSIFGGSITLAGSLDRVRITTVNGTDTFDAGSINIMYE
jgi:hypothetical protein